MWHHLSKVPALALRAIIGLAGVAAFGLVAASAAKAEIKIGFQAPLTGFAATDGKSAKIAAEMAIEEINAAGGEIGQKLQLISYDDQAKSDQAIFTANKLIGEDGVKLVVNASYSASGRAAAPVFQNAGVVMISAYGVHPDITRAGDLMFRLVHLGPPQGRATALFIGKDLKLKQISAITMDNDYGQATMDGFLEAAPKYGIEVLNKYSYSLTDRQFGSIVASVKRDNPDGIYATGYFFTGGPLVAQLRGGGVTAPVIGSQAFDSQKFIDIAGPASEGTYIVDSFDRARNDAALRTFLRRVHQARRLSAGKRRRHLLFGGHADGGRDQARRQRRSGQGARRAGGDQKLPVAHRQTDRLQQTARSHPADQRQRHQGRQDEILRQARRPRSVRAAGEIADRGV